MTTKKRNVPIRPVKRVLHIFCEGAKTEPNYLRRYLDVNFPGDRRRQVIRFEPTAKTTPIQLVEEAVKMKKSPDYPVTDVFWVVYDREAPAKYPDELHARARSEADANGVKIALSNICFEQWLLLHFIESTAPYSSYDNLIAASPFLQQLSGIGISDYEKGGLKLLMHLSDARIVSARTRAKKMNDQIKKSAKVGFEEPHQLNPYSNVFELLDEIDKF